MDNIVQDGESISYAEKQEVIVTVRRRVYAAMETGNPQVARTLMVELAELDAAAAFKLRANIVKDYGTDI